MLPSLTPRLRAILLPASGEGKDWPLGRIDDCRLPIADLKQLSAFSYQPHQWRY